MEEQRLLMSGSSRLVPRAISRHAAQCAMKTRAHLGKLVVWIERVGTSCTCASAGSTMSVKIPKYPHCCMKLHTMLDQAM